MKDLFVIDLHDYEDYYRISKRPSARGIIINEGKIALVYSKSKNYYKLPGGGLEKNEDLKTALIREVKEEVGLIIIPESITEFGRVLRSQKSNYFEETIFEQENFYFLCKAENCQVEQNLDSYEKEADFVLRFTNIDDAIETNQNYHSDDGFDVNMIKRELMVFQLIKKSNLIAEKGNPLYENHSGN